MPVPRQVGGFVFVLTKCECASAYAVISFLTAIWIAFALSGPTNAQDNRTAMSRGVMHVLKASLALADKSPLLTEPTSKPEMDLRISVRISDHAPGSDFFGIVTVDFTGSDLTPPGIQKTVWQAGKCHQDRGWPKVTVIGIEGTVSDGAAKTSIAAIPRHIGKLIPADEIVVTKQLPRANGNFDGFEIRAETKATRLMLDLRLRAVGCKL